MKNYFLNYSWVDICSSPYNLYCRRNKMENLSTNSLYIKNYKLLFKTRIQSKALLVRTTLLHIVKGQPILCLENVMKKFISYLQFPKQFFHEPIHCFIKVLVT